MGKGNPMEVKNDLWEQTLIFEYSLDPTTWIEEYKQNFTK